ncbi:MAG: OmpA family protein, partial [Cyclobacteriaceae bacterium]|nr:OmpA family protein [Cyclobacteriaceae bacterium]
LSLLDASTNEEIYLAHTNPADGWYSIVLTEGKKYRIMATAPGYSDEELNFDLITIQKYEEVSQNIKLFANAKLAIKVFDKEKLTLTGANLTVKDGSGKVIPKLGKRAEEGKATLELPIDNKYTIEANEENFIGSSYSIDLTSLVKYEAFEQDMEIEPITLEFEFTVRDSETKAGINADIILLDKFSEQIRIRASEGKDGNFKRELRDGYKYEVDVHVPGKAYFSYSANIEASSKTGNNKLLIELTEIKPNLTFTLDNINFEVNSAELLETSFRELGKVIKLMREYPGISVELSAHTDSDGSDTYNMKLSEARAKSVVDYLLQYGLEVRRLTPKGYGETAPIAPNDTPENKALNRRVELKVLRVDVN